MIELQYFYCGLVIISIGIFLDTVHSLYFYQKYYSKTGLFNLEIIRNKDSKSIFSKILIFLNPLINEKTFYIVLLLRVLLSVLLIFFPHKFSFLIFFVFLLQLLFNIRSKLSLSGADQMRTILLFGFSIMSLNAKDYYNIGVLFIVIQMYVSYFFTGYNKLKSSSWNRGKGLILVMNNDLFGNRTIQKFLIDRGRVFNIILCWGIILFQLLFPLFASMQWSMYYILIIGVIFHLSLAVISNLNDFFWIYISAYPIIIYFTKYVCVSY